jgi:hypothetical protein
MVDRLRLNFGRMLVMLGASLAPASGFAMTGIALSCEPRTDPVEAVCHQLLDIIGQQNPGKAITLGDAAAAGAGHLPVRLHVETLGKDRISAHLEWRNPGQDWARGETLSMDVMDHSLTGPMVARFLENLWARSPLGR